MKYPQVARPHLSRPHLRSYWYVHGHCNGKTYTRGGNGKYASESEARSMGLQMFPAGADWNVYELPTRDLSKAKHMLADKELTMGRSLDQATARKFTKIAPLEQMRR